jgi:hypothetical protein
MHKYHCALVDRLAYAGDFAFATWLGQQHFVNRERDDKTCHPEQWGQD